MWFESFKEFLASSAPQDVKRRQYIWMGGLGLLCLGVSATFVSLFFNNSPQKVSSPELEKPLSLETAASKVDLNEARWYKLEDENKKLKDDLTALKVLFQEGIKSQGEEPSEPATTALEERIHELESQLNSRPAPLPPALPPLSSAPSQGAGGSEESSPSISKFSLNLNNGRSSHTKSKTVDDFIPAGAFARTVLLSGLDASASMNASSDPRPMLLRIIHPGNLPRRFQSDLKDCHCLAAAYGDLSSERIYARLEKLTCVTISTGEIIETQVAGYIAGSDGKAGIRGRVASKEGQLLSRSLMGGVFSGLSSVANPANRKAQVNPFFAGNPTLAVPQMGETFISGMSQGVSNALDRLSQYYIDRAEQLQPVIQVDAGQVVDIVFTEGTTLGDQTVKHKIEEARGDARASQNAQHSASSTQN